MKYVLTWNLPFIEGEEIIKETKGELDYNHLREVLEENLGKDLVRLMSAPREFLYCFKEDLAGLLCRVEVAFLRVAETEEGFRVHIYIRWNDVWFCFPSIAYISEEQ